MDTYNNNKTKYKKIKSLCIGYTQYIFNIIYLVDTQHNNMATSILHS